GVVLGGFAVFCVFWQQWTPDSSLLQFALRVMLFAYSGLLAVFACAVFTKRGSSASAVAALVVGFAVTLLLEPPIWERISSVVIAWPWRMTIATVCALGVAMLGRGSKISGERSLSPTPPAPS